MRVRAYLGKKTVVFAAEPRGRADILIQRTREGAYCNSTPENKTPPEKSGSAFAFGLDINTVVDMAPVADMVLVDTAPRRRLDTALHLHLDIRCSNC